jgi:TP901 family phage tail tape measure protein
MGAGAVKMSMDFDQSMRNVNSISKLSEKQFQGLRTSVLGLAGKVGKAPKDLADGLYDIASSGFQGAAGMKVLEASAKAARAGMTDTKTAAKAITGALNAYGMGADKAGKVADILFRGVDRGVITFEELAQQIGDVNSTAAAVGITLDQTVGAVAAFTKAGVTGAESVTALNRVIMSFIKPSEQMGKFIKESGYESGQAMLKHRGLAKTMDLVRAATKGNITALGELFPEIRGIKGALIAVNGEGKLFNAEMLAAKDHTNAASKAFAEQSKGPLARLEKSWARVQAVMIGSKGTAGASSAFARLAEQAAGLAESFGRMSPPAQDAILKLGIIGAASGPLLQTAAAVARIGAAGAIVAGKIGLAAVALWGLALAGVQAGQALGDALGLPQVSQDTANMLHGMKLLTDAQYKHISAINDAKDGILSVSEATKEYGRSIKTAGDGMLTHNALTARVAQSTRYLRDAQARYTKALSETDQARKTYGKGSVQEATAMGKQRDALRDLRDWEARVKEAKIRRNAAAAVTAQLTDREAASVNKTKRATDKLNKSMDLVSGHKRTVNIGANTKGAIAGAKSVARAAAVATKPKTVIIKANPTNALQGAQRVHTKIRAVPPKWTTTFGAITGGAISAIRSLINWISGVHDKTVTITTVRRFTGGGGGGGGARAAGGPVSAGKTYLIGEKGPELLTMPGRGYVTPNNKIALAPTGTDGGGAVYVSVGDIHVYEAESGSDVAEGLADAIGPALRGMQRTSRSARMRRG